jgi:hypothetical protein
MERWRSGAVRLLSRFTEEDPVRDERLSSVESASRDLLQHNPFFYLCGFKGTNKRLNPLRNTASY